MSTASPADDLPHPQHCLLLLQLSQQLGLAPVLHPAQTTMLPDEVIIAGNWVCVLTC